ncbi:DMT family transporter [Streptomyces europaeiscabiei]|uniref:DMT family transporter n=1 Tax=Streptomyces europaeiscabiei TaxID=146819 RepID=A0ABU4NQY8_9ACTN|nr:DMT family transporter [Streptomyces europaeiscabiei]MDX2524972.1 DMT family transporter [Streptomyces europaeiscabiei]MDX2760955.1 DMT family transporter [Streptomyces europaeiscabiei]MDX2772053.1 DMT family transporter [Streptomyces europaeiscabiei]MDX3547853.1 DMT family transporter [Streptomyces europaeiscabiei]MDX3557722.1 DMT family transporter [Streptomyces europaeiscabiei]
MTNDSRSTPTRKVELLAAGAAAVTVVLWASAFVSIRSAGEAYSPGALALGRLLAGALALGAIWLVRREGVPPRAAWRGIAVSGVLWFGFYMVALNWGEQQVDAGTAALVVNIGPILIALLGARLLGDTMPPRLLAGMAVSFAGAVAVGLSMSGEGGASVLGVVLCVLAAVGYAAGVVAQKPALGSASPLQVTTFGCLVGAVVCLPFAGQLVREAADAPVTATLNMVYLGVFPTALAFTTWAYALARTTASRMGATTYAVPALVVLMSWLALGEVPGLLTLAGGALCLAGVAVSRSRARTREVVPGAGAAAPDVVPEPRPGPPPRGRNRSGGSGHGGSSGAS